MLSFILLNVTYKIFMLSVVMLNAVILNVVAPFVLGKNKNRLIKWAPRHPA
jgi:hypothetical protein